MIVTLVMSLRGTPFINMSCARKSENKHWQSAARGVALYLDKWRSRKTPSHCQ